MTFFFSSLCPPLFPPIQNLIGRCRRIYITRRKGSQCFSIEVFFCFALQKENNVTTSNYSREEKVNLENKIKTNLLQQNRRAFRSSMFRLLGVLSLPKIIITQRNVIISPGGGDSKGFHRSLNWRVVFCVIICLI